MENGEIYDEQEASEIERTRDYSFRPDLALKLPREALFVIDTPPPTVSGTLHMGHVLSYCHIDFIARYQRMMGKHIFFPIGFDDNGQPTKQLIEKFREDNPNSEFTDQDIIAEYTKSFRELFDSLAMSFDWSLQYSTSGKIAQEMTDNQYLEMQSEQTVYVGGSKVVMESNGTCHHEPDPGGYRTDIFAKTIERRNKIKEMAKTVRWHPSNALDVLNKWIDELSYDWCLTRTGSYGLRIFPMPSGMNNGVWSTWFISAATAEMNATGYYELREKLYPADLRAQGHDIIRTWAFYSIARSVLLGQKHAPWKNIMISGMCMADDRTKMSKSTGNALSPVGLIALHGADALRYWAAKVPLGNDTVYDQNTVDAGKKLIKKLLSVYKLVTRCVPTDIGKGRSGMYTTHAALDMWIVNQFVHMRAAYESQFAQMDYCLALQLVESFFFEKFCNNYLECAKKRAYLPCDDNQGYSAKITILQLFIGFMEMFEPFLPIVTAYIVKKLQVYLETLSETVVLDMPDPMEKFWGEVMMETMALNRKIRSAQNWSPKKEVIVVLGIDYLKSEDLNNAVAASMVGDIMSALNAGRIEIYSIVNDLWGDCFQNGNSWKDYKPCAALIKYDNVHYEQGKMVTLGLAPLPVKDTSPEDDQS